MKNYREYRDRARKEKTDRNAKIVAEYLKGDTTMQILGAKHGISRQRVHQLLEQSSRLTV